MRQGDCGGSKSYDDGSQKDKAMNSTIRFKSTISSLLTAVGILALASLFPNSAHAIILKSTTTLPTMSGTADDYYFVSADPSNQYTNTFYDLGAFTFENPGSIPSLAGLQVTISLNGLDTRSPGSDDYGHIDLTINGIDTGVQMNGFTNGTTSPTITGVVSSDVAAAIYSSFEGGGYNYILPVVGAGNRVVDSGNSDADPSTGSNSPLVASAQTSAGMLVVGLQLTGDNAGANAYNTDDAPNIFKLAGGTATLSVSENPIPFEPSQAMGFGLIALFIALWYVPATKDVMKRLLVPANA
jgi:hypothetical protein